MELKKVMVIGAGQMGSGIAQVMAAHGVEVVLRDIKQEFVDRGIKNIEKNLTRSVEKGRITEDEKKATLGRITGVVEMTKETCNVHLAIEAATENVKIKKDIFRPLMNSARKMPSLPATRLPFPSPCLAGSRRELINSSACTSLTRLLS